MSGPADSGGSSGKARSPGEVLVGRAPGSRVLEELTEAEKQEYIRLRDTGEQEYGKTNYEGALTSLAAAYEIFPKASILFNLGLISERLGELESALVYYQMFLSGSGISLADRGRAAKRMEAITQILETAGAGQESRVTDLMPALSAMGIDDREEPEQVQVDVVGDEQKTEEGSPGAEELFVADSIEVSYGWPVFATFGTATAMVLGGVATRAIAREQADRSESNSTMSSLSTGLLVGSAVFLGLGATLVIVDSYNAKAAAGVSFNASPTSVDLKVTF